LVEGTATAVSHEAPLGRTLHPVLEADRVDEIADLCDRAFSEPPGAEELLGCLFADDEPACVRGDPQVGVVATALQDRGPDGERRGFVKLLVVDPAHQRNGHGRSLLVAAEQDLAGASTITIGADAPYYLFPGVSVAWTPMQCLLERYHYERAEVNFDMAIDLDPLDGLRSDGARLATEADRSRLVAFMDAHWCFWKKEVMKALDRSTLFLGEDDEGITGFCAVDVNRYGLLGPVAVRPDLMGKGAGARVLDAALAHLRQHGRHEVRVSWVSVMSPYARVGATIIETYIMYRKRLTAPSLAGSGGAEAIARNSERIA
jgi:GNAT superfamily N-acetyltransferase